MSLEIRNERREMGVEMTCFEVVVKEAESHPRSFAEPQLRISWYLADARHSLAAAC